ncbi:MAG: phosphoserine phosphatase SerB [Alphaproteobacteria bacterium]|nr:phosphoserine phosphatase SerB [Alphaproteobacteria bacterium]
MSYILTLVASDKKLTLGHLAGIERFCAQQGVAITNSPVWLSPHKAADIGIASCLTQDQIKTLWEALSVDKIDVFCTSVHNRQKKLFLADMDATIVTTETLDELAEHAGIGEQIAAITARAMNGDLDFHEALRERVALLDGLSVDKLKVTLDQTRISAGADILLKTLRQHHVPCVLVSGGFTFFTGSVADQLGFTAHHGNTLEIKDGHLTGQVIPPILDKNSKLSYLHTYAEDYGLDLSETLAIGDGANDLPMLSAAGLGVGYRPKKILQETLRNCLFYGDLSALLYAQGYNF